MTISAALNRLPTEGAQNQKWKIVTWRRFITKYAA